MTPTDLAVSIALVDPALAYNHSTGLREAHIPVHNSCSQATCTSLVAWNFSDVENDRRNSAAGICMGCEDGTLYIFLQNPALQSEKQPTATNEAFGSHLELSSRLLPKYPSKSSPGHSSSPSASSSRSNLVPITVSKSRVVSGLSKEQVEAPKNYVDFEEEEERLKDIINDRTVKDRKRVQPFRARQEDKNGKRPGSPSSRPRGPPGDSSRRTSLDIAVQTSSTASLSPSLLSVSSPPSPGLSPLSANPYLDPALSFSLKSHIVPHCAGLGHAIVDISHIPESNYLISLAESGFLSVHATQDGSSIASMHLSNVSVEPKKGPNIDPVVTIWSWHHIRFAVVPQAVFILACAKQAFSPGVVEDDCHSKAHVALLQLQGLDDSDHEETSLTLLGEFDVAGMGLVIELLAASADAVSLFYISATGDMMTQSVAVLPEPSSVSVSPVMSSSSSASIPFQNVLRALRPQTQKKATEVVKAPSRIIIAEPVINGRIDAPKVCGVSSHLGSGGPISALWSDEEVFILCHEAGKSTISCVLPIQGCLDVTWENRRTFIVLLADRTETYALNEINRNGDTKPEEKVNLLKQDLVSCCPLRNAEAACVVSGKLFVSTRISSKGARRLELYSISVAEQISKARPRRLWSAVNPVTPNAPTMSSVLPLDFSSCIVGYGDGSFRKSGFEDLTRGQMRVAKPASKIHGMPASIVSLHTLKSRSGDNLLVGGGDDGSIFVWNLETAQLKARWVVFTTPLAQVIYLVEEEAGNLRNCALCISQDGTIAVIDVDGLEYLYLIPGSSSPLVRLCLSETNCLLFYADNRARFWDVQAGEFWRSAAADKAEEMIQQGGWYEARLASNAVQYNDVGLASLPNSIASTDAATSMLLDVKALIRSLDTPASDSSKPLKNIHCLLSVVLTPGLDDGIDHLARDTLGIPSATAIAGTKDSTSFVWVYSNHPHERWQVSTRATALRLILIVTLLRVLGSSRRDVVDTIITYYATSLRETVGGGFCPPSLAILGQHWLDISCPEVRDAAKLLFTAEIAQLTDTEVTRVIENWRHRLPCLQPDGVRQARNSALALWLCGNIAISKFNLLSTSTLNDIVKSMILLLHDEGSPHRVLAIELCAHGFDKWQHYCDAMDVLRTLFIVATTSKKESINVSNPGPHARNAVLQIAEDNSPLFMTTLSLDILHPRSTEYSKSVMQVIAFIIRKKPLVLFPNIPRLVEAVVKSLDPNGAVGREAVLDAATEILGQVVRTFPIIDFHMATQRLAVGTSEGAVIMYDLKTATRLYVLEGHRKRLTAINFSPDGRRLVTLSLEESVVLVWKVGSSFSTFFNPGAPPRQGHSGSDPYKTLSFNIGDEGKMSFEGTLDLIAFDWPSDRSVKIKIRESVLTFST